MRIAVISDVHSAYKPFLTALSDARAAGFDQLILLGDLFTYGVQPEQCAVLAAEAIAHDGAILIGGNHDQLYVDFERGDTAYFDRLPDWIRESVEWTWQRLGQRWPDALQWQTEWSTGELFMAHANPFGYGDWTYLSSETEMARAAKTCAETGFRFGVFGHLHRTLQYADDNAEIHVVGSIGQPRSVDDRIPQWAMLDLQGETLTVTRHNIAFDAVAHCDELRRHPDFSESTRNKLCGFFE